MAQLKSHFANSVQDANSDQDETQNFMGTKKMKQSKSYQNLQSAKALFGNISDRRAANL